MTRCHRRFLRSFGSCCAPHGRDSSAHPREEHVTRGGQHPQAFVGESATGGADGLYHEKRLPAFVERPYHSVRNASSSYGECARDHCGRTTRPCAAGSQPREGFAPQFRSGRNGRTREFVRCIGATQVECAHVVIVRLGDFVGRPRRATAEEHRKRCEHEHRGQSESGSGHQRCPRARTIRCAKVVHDCHTRARGKRRATRG